MGQQHKVSGRATSIYHHSNGTIAVRYHSTDVVMFNDKTITLDSGRWRTATTKTRMNQASNQFGLGYYVFQKDFSWFVEYKGKTIDFQDHMEMDR